MTDFVTVEPAHKMRGPFALWCLAQTPQIMTSSASGFDVPMSLYPDVPPELLSGAYVDGFLYDHPAPQPAAAEPVAPPSEASASSEPVAAEAEPEATANTPAPRKRNSRARKASQE